MEMNNRKESDNLEKNWKTKLSKVKNLLWKKVDDITNLPTSPLGQDMTQGPFLSLTGLNSEFSFSQASCLIKAEEPSLSNYLPIAGGRIIGFISFPRVLVLCEMQTVSSKIWTRVALSIFFDDNHYTTGTSEVDAITFRFLINHHQDLENMISSDVTHWNWTPSNKRRWKKNFKKNSPEKLFQTKLLSRILI